MRTPDIKAATAAAKRFIVASNAVIVERGPDDNDITGTKRSGALRRASLDLTRALADMRHPWRKNP